MKSKFISVTAILGTVFFLASCGSGPVDRTETLVMMDSSVHYGDSLLKYSGSEPSDDYKRAHARLKIVYTTQTQLSDADFSSNSKDALTEELQERKEYVSLIAASMETDRAEREASQREAASMGISTGCTDGAAKDYSKTPYANLEEEILAAYDPYEIINQATCIEASSNYSQASSDSENSGYTNRFG